ncbi:MAG: DUF72 domain-containing protein [Candidatus Amoebophilus sp.]
MHPYSNMIYIGCSGWSYKNWKSVFYPPTLSSKNYFAYYATHFKTVEVNSTFYHFPTSKTAHTWVQQTPSDFRFTLKVSREITHLKRMHQVRELLNNFYGLSDTLKDKLGCFLFQFPASFRFTPEHLERILEQLDPCYRNVLEFRDSSWWHPEIIRILQEHHIICCTVSGFGLPEDLNITDKAAYIRLHGYPIYTGCYSEQELVNWAQKIKVEQIKELWVYFNNTMHGHAIQNASELKKLLELT